ncbi:DUF5666 domain-containing protein [Litoribrevibacter euphylliae]|uniref:DUF5666 domain-containing protein n=1 Tax=Litoribrevibacter euphylliae TaxID=1834034 RepID=A0ABV7HDY1_9GAMM
MNISKLIQVALWCLLTLVGCVTPHDVLTQHSGNGGNNSGGIGGTGVISNENRVADGLADNGLASKGIAGAIGGGIGGTGVVSEQGIGGTGKALDNGIGGTGQQAQLDDAQSGEGSGTGGIGGTGIVGTITGFGSIWVNNTRVTFDQYTPITINQQPATSGDFELGQVVAVTSQRYQEEPVDTESWHSPQEVFFGDDHRKADRSNFQAKAIDIVYEVVGPVSRISSKDDRLQILNQDVFVSERTAIVDRRTGQSLMLADLGVGSHIQVSGLRQPDGDIIASRLDVVDTVTQLELIGPLSQSDTGQWQIHDQGLVIDPALLDTDDSDYLGNRVLISGVLDGDQLVVEQLDQDSIDVIFERVNELIYEGYIFEEDLDGAINVGGQIFSLPEVLDFTNGDWDDEPVRINAQQLEDGAYEAYDLWIEEGDDYYDLLPEDDWSADDYFDDEMVDDEIIEDEFLDDEFFDDDQEYQDEYYDEYSDDYYDEEIEYEEVYEE